jgi:DNA-binding beta-propeller fold protein YncE
VASDATGHVYVADRARGVIVKLDATGRVIDPSWVSVSRPRLLVMDHAGHLWIGGDGSAEAPWQRGTGEIWRVSPDGRPALVLRGPMPAGFALGPGGHLYVADRHGARIFVVTADGRTTPFATFTDNDAPRALGFVPSTPQTRQAGIAGDLFLITITRGSWPINEVLRVTGPFEQFVGER